MGTHLSSDEGRGVGAVVQEQDRGIDQYQHIHSDIQPAAQQMFTFLFTD